MTDQTPDQNEFCVFCAILTGDLPTNYVYQDDDVVSIMDINPVTPGHLLVLPRRHLPDLVDLDDEIAAHMMNVARRIAAAHRAQDTTIQGVNLYLADGPVAGQEVAHAHIHVIPRRIDDGFRLSVSRGKPPSREELETTANRVAATLAIE
ncbi:MAG: HIT family protein [Acidimicrobiia bacterium]|nr:HIT family protein [Acidimicrobiia bacterium]